MGGHAVGAWRSWLFRRRPSEVSLEISELLVEGENGS